MSPKGNGSASPLLTAERGPDGSFTTERRRDGRFAPGNKVGRGRAYGAVNFFTKKCRELIVAHGSDHLVEALDRTLVQSPVSYAKFMMMYMKPREGEPDSATDVGHSNCCLITCRETA